MKQVGRSLDIDIKTKQRIRLAVRRLKGCQVDDSVCTARFQRLLDSGKVADVAFKKTDPVPVSFLNS